MDEKILIQSERYNTKKLMFIFTIIGILLIFIFYISLIIDYDENYSLVSILLFTLGYLIIIIGVFIHKLLSTYKLTVTNRRVYGVVKFRKRVDLPMDSISSVSITPWSKGCSISTSSGNINFLGMKNYQNIYECLNRLLIERQEKKANQNHYSDAAEEIIKYKKLLDEGILTKEEFENKKKDILK